MTRSLFLNNFYPVISDKFERKGNRRITEYGSVARYGPRNQLQAQAANITNSEEDDPTLQNTCCNVGVARKTEESSWQSLCETVLDRFLSSSFEVFLDRGRILATRRRRPLASQLRCRDARNTYRGIITRKKFRTQSMGGWGGEE